MATPDGTLVSPEAIWPIRFSLPRDGLERFRMSLAGLSGRLASGGSFFWAPPPATRAGFRRSLGATVGWGRALGPQPGWRSPVGALTGKRGQKLPQHLIALDQHIARFLPRVSSGQADAMALDQGPQSGPPGAWVEQQFPTRTPHSVATKPLAMGVADHLGMRPVLRKKRFGLFLIGPGNEDNPGRMGPGCYRPAQRLDHFRGKDSAIVTQEDQQRRLGKLHDV